MKLSIAFVLSALALFAAAAPISVQSGVLARRDGSTDGVVVKSDPQTPNATPTPTSPEDNKHSGAPSVGNTSTGQTFGVPSLIGGMSKDNASAGTPGGDVGSTGTIQVTSAPGGAPTDVPPGATTPNDKDVPMVSKKPIDNTSISGDTPKDVKSDNTSGAPGSGVMTIGISPDGKPDTGSGSASGGLPSLPPLPEMSGNPLGTPSGGVSGNATAGMPTLIPIMGGSTVDATKLGEPKVDSNAVGNPAATVTKNESGDVVVTIMLKDPGTSNPSEKAPESKPDASKETPTPTSEAKTDASKEAVPSTPDAKDKAPESNTAPTPSESPKDNSAKAPETPETSKTA